MTEAAGVIELILDNTGPGYRLYCVDDGSHVLLLTGGTKHTQRADIATAIELWETEKKER